MIKQINRNKLRLKRKIRIRKKISGTSERPRLCVYKSEKHIYAQIIDDSKSETLVAASSNEKQMKTNLKKTWNLEAAKEVGKLIGERAKEKGITKISFDRSGYIYHGRIKALADSARETGLEF